MRPVGFSGVSELVPGAFRGLGSGRGCDPPGHAKPLFSTFHLASLATA